MNFTKMLGMLFLILTGSLTGIGYSQKLKQKTNFWREFLNFLIFSKNEIRYNAIPITKINAKFYDYSTKYDFSNFAKCLENCHELVKCGTPFEIAWQNSFRSNVGKLLDGNELTRVIDFGKNIGKSDISGQIHYFDYYFEIFKNFLDKSTIDFKTKGKLYRTLGMSVGILMAIIFI